MTEELIVPPEPVLSPEDQTEQDILSQPDACEIILKDLTLTGEPIVWTARESKRLGKRVTIVYEYYELRGEDAVIGYQQWGETKQIGKAGEAVAQAHVKIVGSRKRGE